MRNPCASIGIAHQLGGHPLQPFHHVLALMRRFSGLNKVTNPAFLPACSYRCDVFAALGFWHGDTGRVGK